MAFTWLFGNMDELPFHYPQLCLDVKQWALQLGIRNCRTKSESVITRSPSALDEIGLGVSR